MWPYRCFQLSDDSSLLVETIGSCVLNRAKHLSVGIQGQRRNTCAHRIVLFGKAPVLESILFLVQLVETFLVAANPDIVILILQDITHIRVGQVETPVLRIHRAQHLRIVGNHHQSLSCRGNEDIPVPAQRSLPHRQSAVQCRQVESRICHLPRGIVVSQNTIHTDNEESSVATSDIVSWCAARRFVVLHFHRLTVIHLEPREGSEVVASPDAVLVVFKYPTEEIVGLLYAESLFQGDMVISLADAV